MNMQMMMMMNLMNQQKQGSGTPNGETDGNDQGQQRMMMQMMFPDMFIDEIEPIFKVPLAVGSRVIQGNSQSGVVEVRMLPPTMTSSRASLRFISGGASITIRPSDLKLIEGFMQDLPNQSVSCIFPGTTKEVDMPLSEAYEKGMEMDDELQIPRMLNKMA